MLAIVDSLGLFHLHLNVGDAGLRTAGSYCRPQHLPSSISDMLNVEDGSSPIVAKNPLENKPFGSPKVAVGIAEPPRRGCSFG